MTRKTLQSDTDNCIRKYTSGDDISKISRETGVGTDVIRRALKEAGVELRPRIALDPKLVVDAYLGGKAEIAVAKMFKISRTAVRRRLIEAGIKPRDQSAAEFLKWSGMDADARARQVAAANAAATGRAPHLQSKILHARTVMAKGLHISEQEVAFAQMLAARGVGTINQEAIGPYNCDLGAYPVAVEIWGGNWHFHGRHLARTPERFRYILNAGWHILCIVTQQRAVSDFRPSYPLTDATADYVVAYIEQARRDPSVRREYRVIRGAGEILATGSGDDDDISLEWATSRGRNARRKD